MRFLCNLFLLLFLTDILTFAGDEVDLFKVARDGNALQMKGIITSGEDLKRKDASGRNALMQAVVSVIMQPHWFFSRTHLIWKAKTGLG